MEATTAAKLTVVLEDDLGVVRRMRRSGSGSAAPTTISTWTPPTPRLSADSIGRAQPPSRAASRHLRIGVPMVVCLGNHWTVSQYQRSDVAGDPLRDHCRTWAY